LQSRYYNTEWGRFINADAIVAQTGELLSANMFAYCNNNPVNMSDDGGYWPSWNDVKNGFKKVGTAYLNWRAPETKTVVLGNGLKVQVATVDSMMGMVCSVSKVEEVGKITGYTSHGLSQAIGRDGGIGVSPAAIINAVREPVNVVQQAANNTVKYVGKNATVVLNNTGKVVTTWARNIFGTRGGR
jgi:hypothetical protein